MVKKETGVVWRPGKHSQHLKQPGKGLEAKDRNLTPYKEFARWQQITAPVRFGYDCYILFVTSASYLFTRHVATECCFKITHHWAYYVEMKKWNGKSFSNVSGE